MNIHHIPRADSSPSISGISMPPATLHDVARKARLSAGTVSRVLHGHPAVSAENVARVRDAVAALGYSPRQKKAAMRDLNPLENKNILLLTLGMDRSLAALPVIAAAIGGVEHAAARARANLFVANVPEADRAPELLDRRRIDGVVVKGALQGDLAGRLPRALRERLEKLPVVWILGRPAGLNGDVVQADDLRVGQIAAEHLTSRGHRRLAFISAKPSQVTLSRRRASFTFFAEQAGATVQSFVGRDDAWSFPLPATEQVDRAQVLVDRLLRERRPPTAVFAPDDSMGAMAARAFTARGVRIGRDVSLMSCNNERSLLMGVHPTLTTIDVRAAEIGERAIDQLAWRMMHAEGAAVDIGLEPQLIPGESVERRTTAKD
jgi:DNA-binding LacI/PurR family transcriptional regulator